MKSKQFFSSLLVFFFLTAFAMPIFAQTETETETEETTTTTTTVEEGVEVEVSENEEEMEVEVEVEEGTEPKEIEFANGKVKIIIEGEDDEVGVDVEVEDDEDEDDGKRKRSGIITRSGMLDFGINSYLFDNSLNLPNELDNFEQRYWGSTNVNLHLLRYRLPLIKGHIYIENGVGFAWNQYRFENNFEFEKGAPEFTPIPLEGDFRKNKLRTTAVEMPLMLTIVPGNKQSNYISAGFYGGLVLGARQKIVDADRNKTIIRDDLNLNKAYYGLEARIGLGPVSFYGKYSLVDLFKEGEGPELTPISIGISLVDF